MKNALWSMAGVALLAGAAAAQSTALTYQGRLRNGGAPANGLHDFRFRLFDAATGGAQIGATLCVDNLLVTDGLFTAAIDFGQQFATTGQRYLEVEVRADTGLNCANTTGFVLLAPRQLLTAAPLASHAKAAFTLDAADGSPAGAVFVDDNGRVGIGTQTPGAVISNSMLDVIGGHVAVSNNFGFFSMNAAGNNIGAGVDTTPADGLGLFVNGAEQATLTPGGNLGVGTTSPLGRLDVRGNIRLGPSGEFFAPAALENLRVIRGVVHESGGVLSGSGFSAQHVDVGKYVVTFTTSFLAAPVVVATAHRNPAGIATQAFWAVATDGITTTQVTFVVMNTN